MRLPHTSAVITNLSDELGLVDRMKDAISGELNRRMELLRAAGNFASLRDYDQARGRRADMPALPTLLIVVDEFSELLAAKPRLPRPVHHHRAGRTVLGVHLLLASQRLEEGRLRGLDAYLSYRIGLKTFSAAESRIVLGAADAFELPTAPGNGYLKFDTTGLVRFKSAYVSGAGPGPAGRAADDHGWVDPQAFRLALPRRGARWPSLAQVPGRAVDTGRPARRCDDDGAGSDAAGGRGRRLSGSGMPAHEVWLPPLKEPPSLDLLLPRGAVGRSRTRPPTCRTAAADRPADVVPAGSARLGGQAVRPDPGPAHRRHVRAAAMSRSSGHRRAGSRPRCAA